MRTRFFVFFPSLTVLLCGFASAQTPSTPTPTPKPHVADVSQPAQPSSSGAPIDPAKLADLEKRFAQGKELEQEGKLPEARTVFDGIIAESPEAKGSLQEAALISYLLKELPKADDYLEKLHALVPDYPEAIELLIQVNQALGRDVKVAMLLREFRDLHDSGKVPDFSKSLCFVRERIPYNHDSTIVVSQFFDYTKDPNTVWMAEVVDADGQLQRRLLLNYNPDVTQALRTKDPKYANTQVFVWYEHKLKDGKPTEVDAYLQIFALPEYTKFRNAMQVILANPPKPIYSQAVDVSSQPPQ